MLPRRISPLRKLNHRHPLGAANTYEELPVFKASEILRPEFLQGAIGVTNFSQPDAWLTASQGALRGRIRGDALLNKLIEFSQINRFNEMMLESGLAGLSDIFFHPKTR